MEEKTELIRQLESITMSMRIHPECAYKKNMEFCDMVDSSIVLLRKYPGQTRIDWNTQNLCEEV